MSTAQETNLHGRPCDTATHGMELKNCRFHGFRMDGSRMLALIECEYGGTSWIDMACHSIQFHDRKPSSSTRR